MVLVSRFFKSVYTSFRSVLNPIQPTESPRMPPTISAVLVDDERLARHALRTMLAEHPEIVVVGEAESVSEALEIIPQLHPDVVFLDIQMPGATGFDLLSQIENSFRTVFVTAYDAFAIRAFEVNALDYLLKPVEPERLEATIRRLTDSVAPNPAQPRRFKPDDLLHIASGQRWHFVKISDITVIQADRDYSLVATRDNRRILTRKTMTEWEETLGHLGFMRIHRSSIVSLAYVESIERDSEGECSLRLKGAPDPLPVSRRAWADLKEILK